MNKFINFLKQAFKRPSIEQLYNNAGIKPNLIALDDLITSSGKYNNRKKSTDLTPEVINNLNRLCPVINALLLDLNISKVKVSSGFRPAAVNALISGAAKKSLHMKGLAVDLEDLDGSLAQLILSNMKLLDKYGLWLENPKFTKGWVHLDLGTRAARPIRMFNP